MGSGLSSDHDQLDEWKVYAGWVPQIPAYDHKNETLSYILYFTVIKESSYPSVLLQGMQHGCHMTPNG
jgi:hypothetical protein